MARTLAIATALLVLAVAAPAHAAAPRIIGGTEAAPGQAPYMVALLDRTLKNRFECGAVVIAPQTVLTVAHCVLAFRAEWILLRVGSNDLRKGGQLVRVTAAPVHQKYNVNSKANDIAVMRLATPVDVPPVTLPTVEEDAALTAGGRLVTTFGWGAATATGTKAKRFLQTGVLRVLTNDDCAKKHREAKTNFVPNATFKICAEGPDDDKPDTCRGDSGGPLIATGAFGQPVVLGLTSFGGLKCGRPPPGVYTRVVAYERWIARAAGAR